MCSCDQLRKLVAKERPVRRMSLEPIIIIIKLLLLLIKSTIYLHRYNYCITDEDKIRLFSSIKCFLKSI